LRGKADAGAAAPSVLERRPAKYAAVKAKRAK
jgi:hypothetical protein